MKKVKKLIPAIVAASVVAIALIGPSGASASVGDPVLFVHGYGGSASQFDGLKNKFRSAGWSSNQLATVSYGLYTTNKAVATKVSTAVNNLLAANPGKTKVSLVSHSMGGLSTRYYVKNLGGTAKVKSFVSLASANHGTNISLACIIILDPGCLEMVPGSSFLTQLNSGDETPGSVKYATWWSPNDGVILPPESTILSGAINTQVPGVAHNDQMNNPTISSGVVSFLTVN